MKLKICGMKLNTTEVALLQPDYLGFIFYAGSPRFYDQESIEKLPENVKKVGVFVKETFNKVYSKIEQFDLNVIQLHGGESAGYCSGLKNKIGSKKIEIWKVFSIKDNFDFSVLEEYEPYVDKFLFDTKGENKGGNGYTFNWEVLKNYPSSKEFILSGGIGPEEMEKLKKLTKSSLPLHGIDVNSKFEIEPGLKDVELLRKFKGNLEVRG